MELTESQLERYSRNIILAEVGPSGQERLFVSKVLLVGAGGLGSPAALYLAAAGVGTLGLVDGDRVDLTNLQRQILHRTPDVGVPKVESGAAALRALNPDVTIRLHPERLTAANAVDLIRQYDFVIDGTDTFASKYLVNDACYFARKPFSHAGILRFEGQLFTVMPGRSACYRCLFAAPPPPGVVPSCAQAGVIGVVAGVIGTLQAAEAVKYLLGIGDLLIDALLHYDALRARFRRVDFRRNRECRLCGPRAEISTVRDELPPVCAVPARKP